MFLSIDLIYILEKLILIVIIVSISMVVAMYTTLAERKVAAFIQDRRGPNRAGPFGLLQPLADGLKLFFKEEIIPMFSNKFLFVLGPGLAMLTALMTSAVIPWGSKLELFGREISLQIADINIGILYVFGVVSLGVYGIIVGSWSSNNKYSLMGGLRAASQIISYELALGISLIALLMVTGTLSLKEMVLQQQEGYWNIVYQPLGFFLFLVCTFAECNRTPFDLPEAENELIGGYHTEYSSMKLGFYLFAEYINMFISSAVMATLFFGGYDIPFLDESTLPVNVAGVLGIVALFLKIAFFLFLFIWVRWTIPRFRYDQLMGLGWKVLLPLALLNMFLTGAAILFFDK
ncbi:MAG TPA: NADH-quinone oxidoreductase subunit NuoH [Ferruginibacter sp.]|nr:NADH-quinone oxidoreductase subunit NuoH [Ferruginibacter sp.]HML58922.1 NADH-quinone oxidoreductase subunit NuoH [Ferruginibacter sp.]HRN79661.1 NADH-quinone oxidoreductase subunit NuoH [Ferruginibacter sp.]HRN92395.1 NADH-quinone oxidoreductase subunit NuoH [Ferruginibacter sp.]HRO06578.1 NADH-quinone oxidoreductase subunit NuoH [Ferruginibacter sp.]